MSTFLIVFLGVSVGLAARLLIPGKQQPWDWFASIGFGVLGAALGTGLGWAIGLYHEGETGSLFAAMFGAVLLVFAFFSATLHRRWREGREIR